MRAIRNNTGRHRVAADGLLTRITNRKYQKFYIYSTSAPSCPYSQIQEYMIAVLVT